MFLIVILLRVTSGWNVTDGDCEMYISVPQIEKKNHSEDEKKNTQGLGHSKKDG